MKKLIATLAVTLFAAGAYAQASTPAPTSAPKAAHKHSAKSSKHSKAKTHKGTQHAKRSTAHAHKAA